MSITEKDAVNSLRELVSGEVITTSRLFAGKIFVPKLCKKEIGVML